MSDLDIPTHMLFAVSLANPGAMPGDPDWRNPYADPGYDYKGAINGIMDHLKDAFGQNMISLQKYQHDQAFYTRLLSAMG